MVRKPTGSAPVAGQRRSSLSSLEPIDASPFKRPSSPLFVWFTLLLIWLVSLLPWRVWQPAPDLLLLVIVFWCLHEPGRVNMLAAFCIGLLMDVHDGALLGEQALTFSVAAYGSLLLSRRLQRFNSIVQAIHMLPVFVLSEAVSRVAHSWLAGEWVGWDWLWSALFTAMLWPLADVLLHMPQRRLDETESGSA
ncbi:rod shape-determining protein MreD [Pollutimonas nitritireducens]|uniref:Rod shape-determining protein MreD n=1 Tax=Pollutimonas nitritireducens TaxID=2045209 RepID=A0A2N4UIA7_9BURK|nr:rod shape-determining protein MreD [Pollutimonas nitritireducens]PLC54749.1 rod shape-determining protein MreD [Pollutimonas nitritireducens]